MKGHHIKIKAPQSKNSGPVDSVNIGDYIYHPFDSIGLGFSSNVYLGYQVATKQPVAIKVVKRSEHDPLAEQFLQSQISILEKIKLYNCEHLLKLVHHQRKDGQLYIITQFCEGKDLSKLLRTKKKLSQEEAQTIMKQVMKCYKELYGLSVVHRDIKLSNFMVKDGQLKLGDFGFAVLIFNCTEQFPYNAGSPFYMAPESLKRNRFSFESDVWALGVMAYELIFGQLPYKEKVESVLYDTIMTSNIEQKLREMPELSPHYRQFITRCLQKDMRKRITPEEIIAYQWPKANELISSSVSTAESNSSQRKIEPQPLTPTYHPSLLQNSSKNTLSSTNLRGINLHYTIPPKPIKQKITYTQNFIQPAGQNYLNQNQLPLRATGKSFTQTLSLRPVQNTTQNLSLRFTRPQPGSMTLRHTNYY